MVVWAAMRPGIAVPRGYLTTLAFHGTSRPFPTALMRPPSMMMVPSSISPPETVTIRPAWMAMMSSAAAATAACVLPRSLRGQAARARPGDPLKVAFVGVCGRGAANLESIGDTENVVALCDVDQERAAPTFAKFPEARVFTDYRRMLDAVANDIDAVVISTPDHTHAMIAMAAIQCGKHVYCEKPLAHSIGEIRTLMKTAREHPKIVTQLGNQGHSSTTIRMFRDWVRAGAIGKIHTVHCACAQAQSRLDQLPKLQEEHEPPPSLDWENWLGPVPARRYNPVYLPGRWRGWTAFGSGTVGDWICHVFDPVFWTLELGSPTSVVAESADYDPVAHAETFPRGVRIRYRFPGTANRGPVTLYWYSGEATMPRPENLELERAVSVPGAVVLGDKGGIMYGSHGAFGLRLFPETAMRAFQAQLPATTRPKNKDHAVDWLDAIRKGGKAGSDFAAYGGPLSELACIGNIATHFLGRELNYDGAQARFTNFAAANELIQPRYRAGWRL